MNKFNQQNRDKSKAKPKPAYVPPPIPELVEGSALTEVWLDLVTSAVKGFSSSHYSDSQGRPQMVTAGVVAKASVEVADGVIAAYRERLTRKGGAK